MFELDSAKKHVTIPFHRPTHVVGELENLQTLIHNPDAFVKGYWSNRAATLLAQNLKVDNIQLTPSCTRALELAAMACNIGNGDEVIMPSFTFVSTANAFVCQGAVPVFVDIRPDTMNIDEAAIAAAITKRTKAIVVMHYAGIEAALAPILALAKQHGLVVIEDAAQCIGAANSGRPVGTQADYSCFSFHHTKNVHCGEGGALYVKSAEARQRIRIFAEKGTNRQQFILGQVDKYTWVDRGSNFSLNEWSAAVLCAQLAAIEQIQQSRRRLWQLYWDLLSPLAAREKIWLPVVPAHCQHNAHMFQIRLANPETRDALLTALKDQGIQAAFHYLPLHTSPAGKHFGRFVGEDRYTTIESSRLLRLPLYTSMEPAAVERVTQAVSSFLQNK